MEIRLNGETRRLTQAQTIAALLLAAGLADKRVAVEVDGQIVPKSQHASRLLIGGERVEIVQAIGGG